MSCMIMTLKSFSLFYFLFVFSHMSTVYFLQTHSVTVKNNYESIFSFGDSLTDTGNLLISNPLAPQIIGKLPYGQTYFGRPTGRVCDGRLIIDFIAETFGLPLLQPYLARSRGLVDFRQGANFAVAGATALDAKFLYEQYNVRNLNTNVSLSVQLGWFKELKSSLCNTSKDCNEYFRKSLFLVGEIGINDYTYSLNGGGNMTRIQTLVPLVIETIAMTASRLIEEGAVELVMPGTLPIGCTALYLSRFRTENKSDYDPRNGCLKTYNDLAVHHNDQLKIAAENLRKKFPHAKIYYGDYYSPAIRMFHSPKHYGFRDVLTACCGGGGPYNYNVTATCNFPGSKVCEDPSTHANWDGIHLTEAAYKIIAKGFLEKTDSVPVTNHYESIFNFGDSLTDTGNLLLSNPIIAQRIGKLPYGQTFFGRPTGRVSDGRLIIDFIAEAFGLPLLQPYLASSRGFVDFRQGANFAVGGATALDAKFLHEQYNVSDVNANRLLNVQLGWFRELKSSLCNTSKDCAEYFRRSLFVLGEIGINDYTNSFNGGGNLVPHVIDTIATTASRLIEEGAVEVVMPGTLPIGCTALYQTQFASKNKRDYDLRNGCLKAYKDLVVYHNDLLKIAAENLRRKYPHSNIYYGDYYSPAIRIFHLPKHYGFRDGATVLTACCGGGGPYNYNVTALCALPGSIVCEDPSTHVNWDGIHLTEAAYKIIAKGFLSRW